MITNPLSNYGLKGTARKTYMLSTFFGLLAMLLAGAASAQQVCNITLEWDASPTATSEYDTYRVWQCDDIVCDQRVPGGPAWPSLVAEVPNNALIATVQSNATSPIWYVLSICKSDGAGGCSVESGPSVSVEYDPALYPGCVMPPPVSYDPATNPRLVGVTP